MFVIQHKFERVGLPYSLRHLGHRRHPLHHPHLRPLGCHHQGIALSHCTLDLSSPPVESPLALGCLHSPEAEKVTNLEERRHTWSLLRE